MKQIGWKEASPGVFVRDVPQSDRRLSEEFLEQIIVSTKSPATRFVLIKTKNRMKKEDKK